MSSVPETASGAIVEGESQETERRYKGEFVDALARGLDVICAFSADAPEMTLTEVAARTGLSPATARRCLLTLKELGYVGLNGRRFLLRSKVLLLGGAFLDSMHLRDIADPFLQELAEAFHDSASMAVLEKKEIVYVAHAASKREPRFRVRIGWRLPANATSLGHVLLAALSPNDQASFLKQGPFTRYTARTTVDAVELQTILQSVRRDGYACVQDQLEYGSIAIAVPVHDAKGEVFAAINCSSETSRVDAAELVRSRLPRLREAAREITDSVARYPALVHSINATR